MDVADPTHHTVWLNPLGLVDDDARLSLGDSVGIPIAGLDGVAAKNGLTTRYTYDEDLTDGVGLDASYATQLTALTSRYGYNPFGKGANGFATAITNPAGESTVQITDGAGRTILTINPEGHIATTHYDVMRSVTNLQPNNQSLTLLKTKSIDALGNAKAVYSDAAGRILAS